jgi:hypothetical protein
MARVTVASDRRRRKLITLLWITALSIVTIALIYWEKTALLYILATVGVTALLVTVALADLEKDERITPGASSSNQSPTGSNRSI